VNSGGEASVGKEGKAFSSCFKGKGQRGTVEGSQGGGGCEGDVTKQGRKKKNFQRTERLGDGMDW